MAEKREELELVIACPLSEESKECMGDNGGFALSIPSSLECLAHRTVPPRDKMSLKKGEISVEVTGLWGSTVLGRMTGVLTRRCSFSQE